MKTPPKFLRFVLMYNLFLLTFGITLGGAQGVPSAEQINSDIDVLVRADDYGTQERQLLRDLPVEAIPILIARIKNTGDGDTATALSSLLSAKLVQLGSVVPKAYRRTAIDLMIAECESASGREFIVRLGSIMPLVDPKIDAFIVKLSTSGDESKQRTAAVFKKERAMERAHGAKSMMIEVPDGLEQ